jgi:hypothetical protein
MSMSGMGFSKPPKKTDTQIIQDSINKLNKKLTSYSGPDAKLKKLTVGTPEYIKVAAEAKKLRDDINVLNVKLATSKRTAVQDALQKAKDSGNSDEVARRTEELAGLNATINSSGDPEIVGPQFVEGDDLGNAIREAGFIVDTDDTGKSTVKSDSQSWKDAGLEHFFWVGKGLQSSLPGFSSTKNNMQVAASYNLVEKKILEDAQKKPGGMQALFDRMYKAGLIKKDTYDSKKLESSDFTSGLLYALREFSKKTVRDYEVKGIKNPITFDEYLDKEFTPAGPDVKYSSVTTTRDTAASDLDRFFMQYLGNGASKEQHDQYYKQLRAAEKKAIRTTTTTETSQNVAGEFIDELDKTEIMRKVAGKALEGTDIDTVLKGGAGAAQAVNGVLAYARSYGVNLSNRDALNYVANELKLGQGDTKKINAKILAISKSTYSNLSDSLSEDVSLKELSSNFIYNMGKTLEINPDSIDALDPTIQTALKNNGNKGTMNLTDFDRMLRNDARWARTSNAREEASKYAIEVLKDFGLMA